MGSTKFFCTAVLLYLNMITKKSGNISRVGFFLDFPRPTHHTYDAPPWGVRAEGQTKSDWPPMGVELNGSGGVRRVDELVVVDVA